MVTPLGRKIDEFFDALVCGRSGLVRPPDGHPVGGWLESAGIAPPIDPREVLPPREGRGVDRYVLLALAAADDAMADAGIEVGRDVDPRRVAVVVSTGGGGLETFEEQSHSGGMSAAGPGVSPTCCPGCSRTWPPRGSRSSTASAATARRSPPRARPARSPSAKDCG